MELARGRRLQPRGDEGRRRRAAHLLALDLAHDEGAVLAGGNDRPSLGLGQFVGLVVDALVAMAVKAGLEKGRITGLQPRIEGPVILPPGRLALFLALDHYPDRHRLNTPVA